MAEIIAFPGLDEREWRGTEADFRAMFSDWSNAEPALDECLPIVREKMATLFPAFSISPAYKIPGPVTEAQIEAIKAAVDQAVFANPSDVHAPLGRYSHAVSVPEGCELLFISGQLGARPDGSTPASIEEQADQVVSNIVAILRAHDLKPTDLIKLTTFMVAGHDGNAVRAARLKHLGSHRPASTAVFVCQLVDPAWFVEVEAVSSKRRPVQVQHQNTSECTPCL